MIIHQPEARKENGQFIVSSRIEYDHENDLPNELWFSVDEDLSSNISINGNIFLASLFRVARAMGEDVEIRAEMSPQLLFGLREYLKVHAVWSGNDDIIKINADNFISAKRSIPSLTASCNISGGIDSFYTLWAQLPENEPIPELQVKFGILGYGLSSPSQDEILQESFFPRLKALFKSLKLELLLVDNNISQFKYVDPWISISSCRIALPLLFSPLISTHFLPASIKYGFLMPWSTHPLTDHFFSTESLRVFSHGTELSRYEKLREIKDWEPLYDHLQVCNRMRGDQYNDCTCIKCLQTLMMLDVLGINSKVTTFSQPFKKIKFIGRVITWKDQYVDLIMMARQVKISGKGNLLPFIYWQMFIYKLSTLIKPFLGHKFK